MSYDIAQIKELRTEVAGLKPQHDMAYREKRDAMILSFLPHTSNITKMTEKGWYKAAQQANDGYLETVLYGGIWNNFSPNERLAIESLYYENLVLVSKVTPLYANLYAYISAKRNGDKEAVKRHLQHALWEVLYNSPSRPRNELERDKTKRRRKAQATMLNSLNIPLIEIHAPGYVVEPIRQYYQNMPLEALLPDIVFPLEANARAIAEEIQQINAEVQREIFGQKSIVLGSANIPEATDAFVELITKIMNDIRPKIDEEISKQAVQGKTEAEIVEHINQTIEAYQNTAIPQKMDLLATHFNGKLTELEQREAGYNYYVWHSQDDKKVRPDHAANDGVIFSWDTPPPTGHPGEDYNCRCYAEPYRLSAEGINDPPIEPVYPEAILIPALRLRGIISAGFRRIGKVLGKVKKPPIKPKDILNPNSKPIGSPGNRPTYRVQKGGKKAADDLYDSFGKGKPDTPKGYPGEGKRLPNGDWVGKRPKSKHGEPAVDLDIKDFPYTKIKFPE